MERQYVFFRTARAFWFSVFAFLLLFVLTVLLAVALRLSTSVVAVLIALYTLAVVRFSFRLDRRSELSRWRGFDPGSVAFGDVLNRTGLPCPYGAILFFREKYPKPFAPRPSPPVGRVSCDAQKIRRARNSQSLTAQTAEPLIPDPPMLLAGAKSRSVATVDCSGRVVAAEAAPTPDTRSFLVGAASAATAI